MAQLRVHSVLAVLLFCGCNNSNVATSTLPPTTVVSEGKEYQVGYYFYCPPDENDSVTRWVAFAKDVNGGDKVAFNFGSGPTESLDVISGEGDSELAAYEAMASKLEEHLSR